MKTILQWLKSPLMLIIATVIVCATLIGLGRAYKLDEADWAALGAIGTVLTLIGTIVLATSAGRERRKEQLALALIAAAGLVVQFTSINAALKSVLEALPSTTNLPDDPWSVYAECVDLIDLVGLWDASDLVPLVRLPNHAAANLAWVLTNIRSSRSTLQRLSTLNPLPLQHLEKVHKDLARQLDGSIKALDDAQHACIVFLVEHGFRDE